MKISEIKFTAEDMKKLGEALCEDTHPAITPLFHGSKEFEHLLDDEKCPEEFQRISAEQFAACGFSAPEVAMLLFAGSETGGSFKQVSSFLYHGGE